MIDPYAGRTTSPTSTTSTAEAARRAEEQAARTAPPPVEESPVFRPGFWRSKKFIAAASASVLCFGAAAFTGNLNAQTALLCASPLLGYLGVEGGLDLAAIIKRK